MKIAIRIVIVRGFDEQIERAVVERMAWMPWPVRELEMTNAVEQALEH